MTVYKDPNQKNHDVIVANSVKIFALVGKKCAVASNYDVTVHAEDKAAAITRLAINEASRTK